MSNWAGKRHTTDSRDQKKQASDPTLARQRAVTPSDTDLETDAVTTNEPVSAKVNTHEKVEGLSESKQNEVVNGKESEKEKVKDDTQETEQVSQDTNENVTEEITGEEGTKVEVSNDICQQETRKPSKKKNKPVDQDQDQNEASKDDEEVGTKTPRDATDGKDVSSPNTDEVTILSLAVLVLVFGHLVDGYVCFS